MKLSVPSGSWGAELTEEKGVKPGLGILEVVDLKHHIARVRFERQSVSGSPICTKEAPNRKYEKKAPSN